MVNPLISPLSAAKSPRSQLLAHRGVERHMYGMRIGVQAGGQLRRNPCWPVEPGIALGPGQLEHMGHGLRPIDQFALELGQADLVGLGLDHLVDCAPAAASAAADRAGVGDSGASRGGRVAADTGLCATSRAVEDSCGASLASIATDRPSVWCWPPTGHRLPPDRWCRLATGGCARCRWPS